MRCESHRVTPNFTYKNIFLIFLFKYEGKGGSYRDVYSFTNRLIRYLAYLICISEIYNF